MSEPQQSVKGESVILGMERLTHWVSQNVKFLAVLVFTVLVAGYGAQALKDQDTEAQQNYWAEASELKTPEEKQAFIDDNPDANAAKILALELCRTQLDEANPEAAEATASLFIERNEAHSHLGLAFLLRAYAREELAKNEGAKADLQQVLDTPRYAALAAQALERLN
jgi:predicted negative regulator of RcsB-dependent stress response